jgi:hypothetical protein
MMYKKGVARFLIGLMVCVALNAATPDKDRVTLEDITTFAIGALSTAPFADQVHRYNVQQGREYYGGVVLLAMYYMGLGTAGIAKLSPISHVNSAKKISGVIFIGATGASVGSLIRLNRDCAAKFVPLAVASGAFCARMAWQERNLKQQKQ